jgi:hypothetical protein
MKSSRVAATILVSLLSVAASADSNLRPDTQEPRCAAKGDDKLVECLQTCENKPEASAKSCRKQCLDAQEAARNSCEKKKDGFEIRLPGT